MCWLWLFLAIALEVAATVCLKLSNGLSKLIPTAVMVLLYGVSFLPAAIAVRRLELATVYAVWSAAGTAFITLIGVLAFKETVNPLKFGAIVLIVTGVVCLNVAGRQEPRALDGQRAVRTQSVGPVPADVTGVNAVTPSGRGALLPVMDGGVTRQARLSTSSVDR